uniref:Apple domain-containing protein n=1 Tax=Haemonchus contortus TaxID=6289 RepID=A0A7I5EBC6_HAECO
MMWSSKTLAVVVLILQAYPSCSCTFHTTCVSAFNDSPQLYSNSTASLRDCLTTCYLIEKCVYALFTSGFCFAFADIKSYESYDSLDCNYYKIDRDYIADPEQCKPLSDLP